jgi:hypothetical protein
LPESYKSSVASLASVTADVKLEPIASAYMAIYSASIPLAAAIASI